MRRRSLGIGLVFAGLLAAPLRAQTTTSDTTPPSVQAPTIQTEIPTATLQTAPSTHRLTARQWKTHAVQVATAPVVDGVLDDEIWMQAKPFDNFTQVDPVQGAAPSQRTVVRIIYDQDNLYVGVRSFDDHPELLIGKELRRDAGLRSDDRISMVLDSFGTSRDGFFFQLSITGARRDGLVENNRRIRIEWDGIWWGKTSIDDAGWSAEFRIPFKTLSFNPEIDAWGFNIERTIRRANERIRWANPVLNSALRQLSDAGAILDLKNLSQGLGLDVRPAAAFSYRDDGVTKFDPSLDVFYKITPSIQATLTLNTDFAETEVDDRQVNLTRFSLFFPEKRAFFLQDAGLFEFCGIRRSPLPFFSRRIGIVRGAEKGILGGIKLTGRTDALSFGLLNVQMKDDSVLGQKNLTVARARYNLTDTTAVGLIATNGDPGTTGDNTVVGADFDFFFPTFRGDNTLQGSAYFLRSTSSGSGAPNGGDGSAFGARINFPNEPWSFNLFFGQVDKGFNPALGFAPRRGEREFGGTTRFRWRPNRFGVRRIDLSVNAFLNTDLSNNLVSANTNLPRLEIEDQIGDRIAFFYSPRQERLVNPFTISKGVVLPVGAYTFNRYGMNFSTASSRPVSGRFNLTAGDFFNGRRQDYTLALDLRPSKNVFFSAELIQSDIDLQEGSFITRIVRLRFNINLTPDVSWSNFIQYDNVSDTAGLNSRFRWTIRPGSDFFVVLNQGFTVASDRFSLEQTQITTKIGWTFRF